MKLKQDGKIVSNFFYMKRVHPRLQGKHFWSAEYVRIVERFTLKRRYLTYSNEYPKHSTTIVFTRYKGDNDYGGLQIRDTTLWRVYD